AEQLARSPGAQQQENCAEAVKRIRTVAEIFRPPRPGDRRWRLRHRFWLDRCGRGHWCRRWRRSRYAGADDVVVESGSGVTVTPGETGALAAGAGAGAGVVAGGVV